MWGWVGERLAHPRPSETSRHTFLQACRGSFPSISLSTSSPDLVTGCSCPLPLADLSAWALPLLCFIKSTRSPNPGQLCAQPRGRRRCGRRALLGLWRLPIKAEGRLHGGRGRVGFEVWPPACQGQLCHPPASHVTLGKCRELSASQCSHL